MTFGQLLEHTRFRTIFIASLVFSIIFFVVNIFVIGGDDFYTRVNAIVPSVLALLAVLPVFMIWQNTTPDTTTRRVWGFLLAGMAVWLVGDLIWAYYTLAQNIDVPYPSWADLFWVCGYFLLIAGLYTQFKAYHARPSAQVWRNIAIFGLGLTALTSYFVLLPIVQAFDTTRLLESLLNIGYPLLDLLLLPLCFLILNTLGDGKLVIAWRMITIGFMLRAVSDLMFSYLTWQNIYLPNDNINFISAFYDFIYAMSYLLAGLGFAGYLFLIRDVPAPVVAMVEPEQPNLVQNLILVSTDADNHIISFSDNLLALLGRKDRENIKGASLYEVLGMKSETTQAMEDELRQHGVVDALHFPVANPDGRDVDVRLSALAVYYEGKSFKGANIVLGTLQSLGVQDNLSVESQGVIRSILLRTGNPQKEIRAALSIYFNAQLRMLDDLVHQFGGKTVAQTMRMVINETAMQSGWLVRKDGGDFVILDQADTGVLAASMSALLAAARAYGVDMVGAQMVAAEIGRINENMNPGVMKAVDQHGLRLSA